MRELVQNSLDAVRLQFFDADRTLVRQQGVVRVTWDSERRILEVQDNGTGMTQQIVEDHLLKGGAHLNTKSPDFGSVILISTQLADSASAFYRLL